MPGSQKKGDGEPCLITAETDTGELKKYSADDLRFKVVTDDDAWLAAAYALMAEQFEAEVLDSIDRYITWLRQNRLGINEFPHLMIAAYLEIDETPLVVGTISGNIMRINEHAGKNPYFEKTPYMFAIGHQVTSNVLRIAGFKGIGTRLWNFAIRTAREWIEDRGGTFLYSFLEAEAASVGFWRRQGYLWPKDILYWQPPLEFDNTGQFIYPEVPETLLLKPIDVKDRQTIEPTFLKNIVASVYYYWALDKYKTILSPEAFETARAYVMGSLFDRFCEKIPERGAVPLVPYGK